MQTQGIGLQVAHAFRSNLLTLLLTFLTTHCTPLPSDTLSSTTSGPVISGKSREVEGHLTETLQEARKLGRENPLYLSTLFSLANFYREQKIYPEAQALYRELIAIKEQVSGPDHPDLVIILEQLASMLRETGRSLEAEFFTLRAESIRSRIPQP